MFDADRHVTHAESGLNYTFRDKALGLDALMVSAGSSHGALVMFKGPAALYLIANDWP